jgi:transcriptional regulator with XRE-family HTH domain
MRAMRTHPAPSSPGTPPFAAALRQLRSRSRLSQQELSLRVGVSQRHLSCIETGRARPSREMLAALLDALDAPLAERNDTLLAAGYAPAFACRALAHAEMAPVRDALARLLGAHDPAPAVVMDDGWNLLQANRGMQAMLSLLGVPPAALAGGLNLLRALLAPGGLAGALIDADAVCAEIWQRAQREAVHSAALRGVVDELRPLLPRRYAAAASATVPRPAAPLLETALRTVDGGVLRFFSAFTTFGAPLDVTAASLRVEHFFPADEATRQRMALAVAALQAGAA